MTTITPTVMRATVRNDGKAKGIGMVWAGRWQRGIERAGARGRVTKDGGREREAPGPLGLRWQGCFGKNYLWVLPPRIPSTIPGQSPGLSSGKGEPLTPAGAAAMRQQNQGQPAAHGMVNDMLIGWGHVNQCPRGGPVNLLSPLTLTLVARGQEYCWSLGPSGEHYKLSIMPNICIEGLIAMVAIPYRNCRRQSRRPI